MTSRILLALSVSALPLLAVSPSEIENLEVVSPQLTASSIVALASDGTTLAAIDSTFKVLKSTDNGRTWVPAGKFTSPSGGGGRITDLHHDGTNWVATGTFRAVSTDLATWDTAIFTPTLVGYGAAYGNDTFIAIGQSGAIRYSTDGSNWQAATSPAGLGLTTLRGATYGMGKFVAVGDDGFIINSADGINWTTEQSSIPGLTGTNDDFRGVTFLNNIFFATGRQGLLMTSTNGSTWELEDTGPDNTFEEIGRPILRPDNTYAFPVRFGEKVVSTDLDTFTTIISPDRVELTLALKHNGTYVGASAIGEFAYSDDAVTWTPVGGKVGKGFTDVEFGDGIFVIRDNVDNRLLSSPDGVTWTVAAEPALPMQGRLNYGPSGFAIRLSNGDHLYRRNGETAFSVLSLDDLTENTPYFISQLGQSDGLWYGLTSNIASSPDLITWTDTGALSPAFSPEQITAGGGTLVAVGFSGQINSRTGNGPWIDRTPAGSNNFFAVTHDGNIFITASSKPYTSPDGITWTRQDGAGNTPGGNFLSNPSVGTYAFGYQARLRFHDVGDAPDQWSDVYYPAESAMNDGAEGNGIFVGVGENGLILATPSLGPGYAAWAELHFGANAFPATISPYFDADGDGAPNIVEYGEGTDPKVKTLRQTPTAAYVPGGDGTLTFEQAPDITEVIGVVEYSEDLKTWRSNGVIRTVTTLPSGREMVEGRLTGGIAIPPLFLRLHWKAVPRD